MRTTLLLLLCLALATAARAQSDFHIYPGTEKLVEVGVVEKLSVVSGNQVFTLRPPKGWSHQANEANRKIIFTDQSGRSAVTIQFTTNSPGALPATDVLQAKALQAHPGAQIVSSAVCSTSYQPGVLFDLVRLPAPIQRLCHAYVPQPDGEVEFSLAAPDDEFGRGRIVILRMLRAFRVAPIKPKQP